jgi:fucose permease
MKTAQGCQGQYAEWAQGQVERLILIEAMGAFVVLGMASGLIGATLPAIEAAFAVSHQTAGFLFLSTLAGYLPAGPLVSWMSRRWPVSTLTSAALLGIATTLIARVIVGPWAGFVALGVGEGAALGVLGTTINIYASRHFSPRQISWLHAAFGAGMVANLGMAWYIQASHRPWQTSYLAIAGAALLVAALIAGTAWAWRSDSPVPQQARGPLRPLLALLRLRAAWLLIMIVICYPLESIVARWGYALLVSASALTPGHGSMAIIGFWSCFTLGRLISGLVAGRVRQDLLLGLSAGGVALGALLLQIPLGAGGLLLSLAILGGAMAPVYPLLIAQVAHRLGPDHTPMAIGLLACVGSIGGTSWSGLTGVLAERWGLDALRLMIGVFAGVFFCQILVLVCASGTLAYAVRRGAVAWPQRLISMGK